MADIFRLPMNARLSSFALAQDDKGEMVSFLKKDFFMLGGVGPT